MRRNKGLERNDDSHFRHFALSMRAALAALMALVMAAPASACPGTRLASLIAASSLGKLAAEIDVADVQSAEGGNWRVYLGTASGKPVNIVRSDYGETGRLEHRLVIASPEDYAIIRTRLSYSSSIADPNMKTSVAERSIWTFCGGKLQDPAGATGAALSKLRNEASAAREVFDAAQVAPYVEALQP